MVLSSEFPRSVVARTAEWSMFTVCWSTLSRSPFGLWGFFVIGQASRVVSPS
ncbi:hypothetical protein Ae406Ps2_6239 [Pseudonocardia sp. Ae406_Ps2]|nr:hypothetical protein Ae406Ps2_6239 [Pseudonocardia sp. Ae406_Ps2]